MIEFLSSHGTRAAGLPFSDAVRVGGVLYLSGALGNEPGTMRLVSGGIAAETRQTMTNIARVLEQNGLSFDDVFKATVMLADMKEWRAFNETYLEYFKPDRLPARSAFGCNGLALGARVEMECWAWGK
jgi:2-iminobutanoate/2-iminopropanoate deaminase